MPYRRRLYLMTRGNTAGAPYVDLQLRPEELQAIGHVTAQWAFLEFFILRETQALAKYIGINTPPEAEVSSFRQRRKLWESLSRRALAPLAEELRRALDCIDRAGRLANDRNLLTHSIIEYDKDNRDRLKAYPPTNPGKFGWSLNTERIQQIARGIAHLNHDVLSIHSDLVSVDASQRIRDQR
jgi:hypothetical protein